MTHTVFTDERLDEMRQIGDPPADETIQLIVDQFQDIQTVINILEELIRIPTLSQVTDKLNELVPDASIRHKIIEFFEISALPPSWVQPQLISEGSEIFREQALLALMILGCASLPACYCWGYEAQILGVTGRLKEDVPRRLPETAQMVMDVMTSEGLAFQQGLGIRAVQKVRLLHAAIRVLSTQASTMRESRHTPTAPASFLSAYLTTGITSTQENPSQSKRVPINQEQLAATLLTFSYVILNGLSQVGVRITPAQEAAYMHCWNIIGHHLGIHETITQHLSDRKQGEILFAKLMERNRRKTEDGAELVKALTGYFENNLRRLFPLGSLLYAHKIPKLLVNRFAGTQTSAALDIQLSYTERFLQIPLWIAIKCFGLLKNIPLLQHLSRWFFREMSARVWGFRRAKPHINYLTQRRTDHTGNIIVPEPIADYWKLK
jgi:hypothetical protein